MAQVVELFGAPGTGKSSLVHALDGRRIGGRRLIAAQRLTRVRRDGPLGLVLHRDLTPAERRAALSVRRTDWADLLDLLADARLGRGSEGERDPLRQLHAPGWLAATLELRALADAAPDDVIVALDEGLVQRAPIVCGSDASAEALSAYLGALPPPALNVHLRVALDANVARLRSRARVIDRHLGLDDASLTMSSATDAELLKTCARLLADAGMPVATVSTDGDLHATIDAVMAALQSVR